MKTSLDISQNFVKTSIKFVQISYKFEKICTKLVKLSQNSFQIYQNFFRLTQKFPQIFRNEFIIHRECKINILSPCFMTLIFYPNELKISQFLDETKDVTRISQVRSRNAV